MLLRRHSCSCQNGSKLWIMRVPIVSKFCSFRMGSNLNNEENVLDVEGSNKDGGFSLWKFVTKMGAPSETGGNAYISCNICGISFTGSYSRVRAHLMKISRKGVQICRGQTMSQELEIKNLDAMDARKAASKKQHLVPLPIPPLSNSSQASSGQNLNASCASTAFSNENEIEIEETNAQVKKRKGKQLILDEIFNEQDKAAADCHVARLFYAAGLPFCLASCPYFISLIKFLAMKKLPGYMPPSPYQLKTKHLETERRHVESLLDSRKSTWRKNGVTIMSDGWTDVCRRPLINFIVGNEHGSLFLKAVNCAGKRKDAEFITKLMKEVLDEVESSCVVQIITDNAANCKKAGSNIEKEYPKIFWTPCIAHTLNLALKDICSKMGSHLGQAEWIEEVVDNVVMIQNFILNHTRRLALFHEFSELNFIQIAATRFASVVIMLRRFQALGESLRRMVVSNQWIHIREDMVKSIDVKAKILDDTLWKNVEYILAFTEPIHEMIRCVDTEKPSLHLIYEMWDTLFSKVEEGVKSRNPTSATTLSFWNAMQLILNSRRKQSLNPLHGIAHLLNPRVGTNDWSEQHPRLANPEFDSVLQSLKASFLSRYYSPEARTLVKQELVNYIAGRGVFGTLECKADRTNLGPLDWWLHYGYTTPYLLTLSQRILGQQSSSSSCERNWSTYSFIHSKRRNRLTPKRAEDLVYIHSNLRFLSRNTIEYKQGDCKFWDLELGDEDIGDIANLSLDDPEIEAMLFVDQEMPNENSHDPSNADVSLEWCDI